VDDLVGTHALITYITCTHVHMHMVCYLYTFINVCAPTPKQASGNSEVGASTPIQTHARSILAHQYI